MRGLAAVVATAAVVSVTEARAEEVPPTTPHPALVAGIGELVTAPLLIGTSIWGFAIEAPNFGASMLVPGLALGIQGAITTAHGALDHRALRSPAAASAGHVLTAFGVTTGVLGATVSIAETINTPSEAAGVFVAIPAFALSAVSLGIGIPLLVVGERSAERPGRGRIRTPDLSPRVTAVARPGGFTVVGSF
ncbi:MAG: hypothetical protein U0414_08140 [Polyangiaceae bacterium]